MFKVFFKSNNYFVSSNENILWFMVLVLVNKNNPGRDRPLINIVITTLNVKTLTYHQKPQWTYPTLVSYSMPMHC